MIVHLTGSTRHIGDDLPHLRAIRNVIHNQGSTIAHDWVESANSTEEKISDDDFDWSQAYAQSIKPIERADILIIEASKYSFFQGYQTLKALDQSKPVLFLYRNELPGRIFTGINNKLFKAVKYSDEADLAKIVSDFLQSYEVPANMRKVPVSVDVRTFTYLKNQNKLDEREYQSEIAQLIKDGMKYRDIISNK